MIEGENKKRRGKKKPNIGQTILRKKKKKKNLLLGLNPGKGKAFGRKEERGEGKRG